MPATTDYLATLKIQLDAAAANKKLALDTAYERATNVQFDKEGKMSTRKTPAGNDAGPGTLDVQYAEQQRNIGISNEASGTLKSGQYGRELATSQAGYRSTIAGLNAERISGQTAADTDAASEYAKYKAMYGTPTSDATPTTGGGGTSGGTGGGGGGGGGGTQKPADPTDNAPVTAPPVFNAPAAPNTIPQSTYTNMTPQQKAAVISRTGAIDTKGRSGMGASAPKAVIPQNKQVTSPVTKKPVVTPPKKLKPVGAWDR
jgi:hypothetical protein